MSMMPMAPGAMNSIYIGEIAVSLDRIHGPQGSLPTAGARIDLINATRVERGMPTWAIVCMIVGFFFIFLFSLFFLLAKEDRVVGHYEVRVVHGPNMLVSYVPVQGQDANWLWMDLQSRATQARALIQQAGS